METDREVAISYTISEDVAGPGRQIVIKTGKPSADSRAKPEPRRGRSYSFTNRKVTDCHRSAPLHHFLRSAPVGLSPHTPCRFRAGWRSWRKRAGGVHIAPL